ncbi:MAG: lytic murein transglycosylase B [Gammaproteobacteria bacterium]|nr:lytic murein transglycosylase B [Gammaproteobacteria bacterium]
MPASLLRALLCLACAVTPLAASASASISAPAERADIQAFIAGMEQRHAYDGAELARVFNAVELRPDIIDIITAPAEGKPWYEYRPIFVNSARIQGGVEFWQANAEALGRAEQVYGVPPEIIVAIIGVETRYGRNMGKYRVLDALTTLAFDYAPRADFFRGELEQYLLLARDERFDPLSLKGSYAGAMGQAQFIPSSYRLFAVDFDDDGLRDLWNNSADAIGSVAHYLHEHGWQNGAPVAVRAEVSGVQYQALLNGGLQLQYNLGDLRRQGVSVAEPLFDIEPALLLEFAAESGAEYWVGLHNFYVITRYNRSPLYAMAVYQLSQEIKAQRQ